MADVDVIAIIATSAAVAVAAVSLITFFYQRKKFRLAALMEPLHALRDMRHREARKIVYGEASNSSYEILGLARPTPEGGATAEELYNLAKDIVRSDYNHISTLVRHRLLDEEIFVGEHLDNSEGLGTSSR